MQGPTTRDEGGYTDEEIGSGTYEEDSEGYLPVKEWNGGSLRAVGRHTRTKLGVKHSISMFLSK